MNGPTRTILCLLALFAAAAAINYTVALACALWSPDRAPHAADHQTLAADVGLPADWNDPMLPTVMDGIGLHMCSATWLVYRVPDNDAVLCRRDLPSNYETDSTLLFEEIASIKAGLPLPCLVQCSAALPLRWSDNIDQASLLYSVHKNSPFRSFIEPARLHTTDDLSRSGLHIVRGRMIPFEPLWRSFAINTLFYAAILAVFFRGVPFLRRAIRFHRNQCLTCGYTLNNLSICPECGSVPRAQTESGGKRNPAVPPSHVSSTTRSHSRLLFRICPLLFALCYFSTPAPAQPSPAPAPKKIPPIEIVGIDLGWDGVIPGDRWCPVTVLVTSREKAFSGVLLVDYPQDPTQTANIVVPLATTPGKIIPIEVAVALPTNCSSLSFTIFDDRGREQAHWEYIDNIGTDAIPMPHIGARAGLILTLGDSPARLSVDRYQIANPEDNGGPKKSPPPKPAPINYYQPQTGPVDLWTQVSLSRIKLDQLPLSWAAYEGVDALVAQADDLAKADPRAKAALMEWVFAGGRLVLRADPASNDWRSFLPPGPDGELVTLDPLQRTTAGPDLTALVQKGSPNDPAAGPARVIHLTPLGQSRGWKLSWPTESENSSLKASGPVGLGMVTILGFEPQSLPAAINPATTRTLWREAITHSLAPHAVHSANNANANPYYMYGNADDDNETSGAIRLALDQAATIPPLSMTVFIAIAACMLLLALLIGPFDARILKRLKRSQQSWLTALVWISTASVAAYLVPNAIRSGETMANRITASDTICDIDGIPRQSCQTAVTGIFGGRRITVKIENPPAGAWFRGVSSLSPYVTRSRTLFSPLTLPITVQEPEPYLRGTPPGPFSVSQWSFRGLLDQSPMRPAKGTDVGAKVRAKSDGTWEVTLINVPAGIRTTSATLHVGNHDYSLVLDSRDETPTSAAAANRLHDLYGIAAPPPPPAPAPVSTPDSTPEETTTTTTTTVTAVPVVTPAVTLSPNHNLPGARERADAIEAMLASGHWACVTVTLPLPMDITLSNIPDLEAARTASLRLLTPLDSPHD